MFHRQENSKKREKQNNGNETQPEEIRGLNRHLTNDLDSNLAMVSQKLGNANDMLIRRFTLSGEVEIKTAVILIKGLSEKELINEQVLTTLMQNANFPNVKSNKQLFERISQSGIPNVYIKKEVNADKIIDELITGNAIFFMDDVDSALIIGSQKWKERSISEPMSENVVRGPRDGFTETIDTNVALIRRRIKSHDLRIDSCMIGTQTKTTVLLAYIKGVARESVLIEVKERLKRIHIDGVLESGYIEELIEDNPLSPFPQIDHSERPDKVSAAILEGRVAILVDNTPVVLIVPTVFQQFMQSPEDYYERYFVGSLTRIVRLAAYFASIILPALYIALTSFHQEMLPTSLALSIAASREGVPFPSIGEAFIMEATFEILREAGLRLPKQAGQAVSIVGGLVIGQAAVQAGIVSQ